MFKEVIFVGIEKISFEPMYLENKAEIPKSLTSFWKQRCNKVLGKMWEEQCCWLAIIQQKFTEKTQKETFPFMVISGHFISYDHFIWLMRKNDQTLPKLSEKG